MTRTSILIAFLLTVFVPPASDAGQRTYGDVDSVNYIGVRDGDTFTATIPGWPGIIGDSVGIRIAGINCLETRGSHDSAYEAKAGEAKAFARKALEDATVISLKNIRRGSFFRVIADVEVDGSDLGQMLLDGGLAIKCIEPCRKVRVIVTLTGSKYHYSDCPNLAQSKTVRLLSLEDAIDEGLTPCERCDPPGFRDETQ